MRTRTLLHTIATCLVLAAATVLATPAELIEELIEFLARSQKEASAASKAASAASKEERAKLLLRAGSAASKEERAMLLLRAGETKEALPILEELIRAGKTKEALPILEELIRAGKTKEALPILEELIKAKRTENTPEAIALATELEHQVTLLTTIRGLEEMKELKQAEQEFKQAEQEFKQAEQRSGLVLPLKQVPDPQLKLLHVIDSGLTRFSVVRGRVKEFSKKFEAGARDPGRFLSEVRLHRPELLSEWLAAPQEKRMFIIGAGEDTAKVSEEAERLKSNGYAVFFYQFCRQSSGALCSDEAVGAMFGTAGQAMLYHTEFATASKYVKVEVATAR